MVKRFDRCQTLAPKVMALQTIQRQSRQQLIMASAQCCRSVRRSCTFPPGGICSRIRSRSTGTRTCMATTAADRRSYSGTALLALGQPASSDRSSRRTMASIVRLAHHGGRTPLTRICFFMLKSTTCQTGGVEPEGALLRVPCCPICIKPSASSLIVPFRLAHTMAGAH